MKRFKPCAALLVPLLLCGCLEARQHPPWRDGQYAGKPDNLPYQNALFHNDRLAWLAAIFNRNRLQNEYNRANP